MLAVHRLTMVKVHMMFRIAETILMITSNINDGWRMISVLPSDAKSRYYFDQLFTATLWDLLVVETNRYAQQKGKPFDVTSIAKIKAFVRLTAAMSIRKSPRISNYWSWYWVHCAPQFAQLCTKNWFMSLWYNINLVDNTSWCTKVSTSVCQESTHVLVVQHTCSG